MSALAHGADDARVRVLFVDDEPQILEGLQDSLRRWRPEVARDCQLQ